MTLNELIEKYGRTEKTWTKNFKRTADAVYNKTGFRIVKEKIDGEVVYTEIENDGRALTAFSEAEKLIPLQQGDVSFVEWELLTLIGIIATPMCVFRGSYKEFLKYIEKDETNPNNIFYLKGALESLASREYIIYKKDYTDSSYFIGGLYKAREDEMGAGIETVKQCKFLAEKYNKRSWINLLKILLGVRALQDEHPSSMKRLAEITGLSIGQVRDYRQILEKASWLRTEGEYNKEIGWRIGSNFYLNAIEISEFLDNTNKEAAEIEDDSVEAFNFDFNKLSGKDVC